MIGYEFEDKNKAKNFIDLKISKMRFVWKDQYNGKYADSCNEKYDNNNFDKSSNYNNNNYSNDDNNNNNNNNSNYNDNDNNNNGNNENSKDKKR